MGRVADGGAGGAVKKRLSGWETPVSSHNGFYHFQTVSSDTLSAQLTLHGNVWTFDESSNANKVFVADVKQSNGVIHVIDGVLVPK